MSLNLFDKNYLELEQELDKLLQINGKKIYNEYGELIENNGGSQLLKSYIVIEDEENDNFDDSLNKEDNEELLSCTMDYLNNFNKEKSKDFKKIDYFNNWRGYPININLGSLFDNNIIKNEISLYFEFFGKGHYYNRNFKKYFFKKIKIPNTIKNFQEWYLNITLITIEPENYRLSLTIPLVVISFYKYNKNLENNKYSIKEMPRNRIEHCVFNPDIWDNDNDIISYFYPLYNININNNSNRIYINKDNSFLLKQNNENKILFINELNEWNINFDYSKDISSSTFGLKIVGYIF